MCQPLSDHAAMSSAVRYFPQATLRLEKPDHPLAADAVADHADEGFFGQGDADSGKGGGEGRVAGGGG